MMAAGQRLFGLVVAVSLIFAMGCASSGLQSDDLYPDTPEFQISDDADIADTEDHRQVLEVLYEYRMALVTKDFGTLNRLVSEDYYDNAGTTHTTEDDYGYDNLPEVFELLANYADEIQYGIKVRALEVDGRQASVDFRYDYAYRFKMGDQETWDAGSDMNRLEMRREGDVWRITGGM